MDGAKSVSEIEALNYNCSNRAAEVARMENRVSRVWAEDCSEEIREWRQCNG